MEESISIKDIFKVLLKHWRLTVLFTLLAALISGVISYYVLTPVYQASTQILVNQKDSENKLDFNRLRNNIDLINTYREIIKSPIILDKVIEDLNLKQNAEQLNQIVKVYSRDDSQVFSIIVEDINPTRAVEIVNSVSETFQKEIKEIMNVDNVSVLAKAEMKSNPTPIKPNPKMNIAIAIVIGLMIGIGLSFLIEYMDTSIKESDDIISYLGLPVLGIVQKIPHEKTKRLKKSPMIQKVEGETFET